MMHNFTTMELADLVVVGNLGAGICMFMTIAIYGIATRWHYPLTDVVRSCVVIRSSCMCLDKHHALISSYTANHLTGHSIAQRCGASDSENWHGEDGVCRVWSA
jgi:hypothetical protein